MDVKITHPGRLVYKSAKISKGEVADYYRSVAPIRAAPFLIDSRYLEVSEIAYGAAVALLAAVVDLHPAIVDLAE